eukprot:CAMPEP_0172647758 /NCGR_PEP_ID=MMETSP1068-20121228/240918_1 /TAXON_ID=35684 /ORGANISM="Pseudopedinella elastica, Strain CCMP716" /LENGTH=455 /DNA_ID=CAMNT_0013462047 /DNA_START=224 /DNA_END=1591 /DNA_ORIENTATION=+
MAVGLPPPLGLAPRDAVVGDELRPRVGGSVVLRPLALDLTTAGGAGGAGIFAAVVFARRRELRRRADELAEVHVIGAHGSPLFVPVSELGLEIGDLGLEPVDLVVALVVLLERLFLLYGRAPSRVAQAADELAEVHVIGAHSAPPSLFLSLGVALRSATSDLSLSTSSSPSSSSSSDSFSSTEPLSFRGSFVSSSEPSASELAPGDVEWAASASAIPPLGRCGFLALGRGAVAVDHCGGRLASVSGLADVVRVGQLVHRPPEAGELLLAATVGQEAEFAPQCFGPVLREVAIVYAPGDTRQREHLPFCRVAFLLVVAVLPDKTKPEKKPIVCVCACVGVGGFVVRPFIFGVVAAGVGVVVAAGVVALAVASPFRVVRLGVVALGVAVWAACASAIPISGGAASNIADGAARVWKSAALGNPGAKRETAVACLRGGGGGPGADGEWTGAGVGGHVG